MNRNLILLEFILLFVLIHGQRDDDRNMPIGRFLASRTSKSSFDTEFTRGRCPQRFYQLGEECVFFANDGKAHSWRSAERICMRRIARILNDQSSSTADQPNMQPTKGVRQLVLNTPEKTDILRALYRDYNEQNFAVQLPYDYNTLQRCRDGQDDKWPHYCSTPQNLTATCYETVSGVQGELCLREVDCSAQYLRIACEFTLPGSSESTSSTFRTCPQGRASRRRLPIWAWIAIILGSILLLLVIIAVIFSIVRKSKQKSAKQRYLPEKRQPEEKVKTRREDPADEPMLVRATPTDAADTGYLEPRVLSTDNTANA